MTGTIQPATPAKPQRTKPQRPPVLFYLTCTVLFVLFAFPIFWSVLTSFKAPAEASAVPSTFLPSRISLENYANLARYGDGIGRYLANSLIVTALTVLGAMLLSTLGGYGFSRFNFPAKNLIFLVILVRLMIPFQSILTPLLLLLRRKTHCWVWHSCTSPFNCRSRFS